MLAPRRRAHPAVFVALFAALTALGAFIRVPLPTGVPFTLQIPAVLLAGVALGPVRGSASQLAYLACGLLGLPVFATGGGPGYLLSPNFGFLAGFVGGAAVAGLIAGDPVRSGMPRLLAAMLGGLLVIYSVGVPWLGWNFLVVQRKALPAGLLLKMAIMYFPLDLVKIALLIPVLKVLKTRGCFIPSR